MHSGSQQTQQILIRGYAVDTQGRPVNRAGTRKVFQKNSAGKYAI
jgi:hypothetical protein